jgi:hypothetical protein
MKAYRPGKPKKEGPYDVSPQKRRRYPSVVCCHYLFLSLNGFSDESVRLSVNGSGIAEASNRLKLTGALFRAASGN